MSEHAERLVHSIVVDTSELTKADLSSLGQRERDDLSLASAQLERLLRRMDEPVNQLVAAE